MMEVYWLEQSEADVPEHDDWLAPGERLCLNSLRFLKRRTEWRLGRWTAKQAVSVFLGARGDPAAFRDLEIRPAPSGAPEVFFGARPAPASISLTHSGGVAACAVARPDAELGCDLEMVEPRSPLFVADYFTEAEQALIARAPTAHRWRLLALLWSAKESTLKALHEGLRLDTRSVIVSFNDEQQLFQELNRGFAGEWRALRVTRQNGRTFIGWWLCRGNLIQTLVAFPPPSMPIRLRQVTLRKCAFEFISSASKF
jgi:4'-phosphopantetheinyl transferase